MLEKVFSPREIEKKWSSVWEERRLFEADAESPDPAYCIVLPPPNVTGMLTVGHALGTTVQDILCRWKRLSGFEVLWLPGTDHAGIATQNVVERALAEKGLSREELGRDRFIEECWRWKEKYHGRIVEQLSRLGASLDWNRETFTLDEGVSRAVREVFVRLYDKGLIYRGEYIVNWCPRCRTAISDEEVEFVEKDSSLFYIAYPFADREGEIVVGTTRPETMLGDVAVAMSPQHERASELEGARVRLPLTGREIPVILDSAVDPEFGTGFLKVTPAHDPVDFEIGRRHRLEPFQVIDSSARMNGNAGRFAGLGVDEARGKVLEELKEQGLLRKIEDYRHSVGHHDRCSTVIEPFVSKQWFLKMESLAAPALDVVKRGELEFFPERWKNIYLSWMEDIRDWCISRQLWWGHRIPVWYCRGCEETTVAREEPERCPSCGGEVVQDEDVLDTWFSSWLWTFSPMGWPGKTADLEKFHPTDVLVTGGDIIFFWVARMIMASLEFMGETPFDDVYITGIVRDAGGRKMSKSLGNSPDMIDIIERSGADAFRFSLMMLSPPGQDLLFDGKKVDVGRHFANKVWNAARFVLSREEAEDELFRGDGLCSEPNAVTGLFERLFAAPPSCELEFGWEDRWIASRLAERFERYASALDGFRFDEASRTLYDFFWHEYCDWYLEFSKPALREGGERGAGAALTARTVLGASLVMMHPIMPFISEEIWAMLSPDPPALAGFRFRGLPAGIRDAGLDEDVGMLQEIVTNIRNLRQSFGIPHNREVEAVINCQRGSGLPDRLEKFAGMIRGLASVDSLTVAEGAAKPPGSAAAGLAHMEIYVPLEGVVDVDEERRRLGGDIEKLTLECGKIEKRLEDGKFLERAPGDVIERERERLAEMSDRRRRLVKILEDLASGR